MEIKYPNARVGEQKIMLIKDEELAFSKDLTVDRRNGGSFVNKAFFLNSIFDWIIVKDNQDYLCLVPLKKTGD